MKPKILFIYNPVAGSKSRKDVKQLVLDILKEKNYEVEVFETIEAKKQPLDPFKKKHFEKVVVSGGDGTVAEVISFLIENKLDSPLIIIPQGSANILALSLKLPLEPKKALLHGLKNKGSALDAMKVNDKYYSMIATGLGYDTLIMQQTTRGMKRRWGPLAYVWTILKTIVAYRGEPYKLVVDGKRETVYAKTVMIFNLLPLGNTRLARYFVGQNISATDGKLNIAVLNPRPITDLLFFRKRMKVFSGKKVVIQQKKSHCFQIDGNVFKSKTVEIKVVPRAVRIAY